MHPDVPLAFAAFEDIFLGKKAGEFFLAFFLSELF